MKTRYTWPLLLAACSFAACAQAPDGGRVAQIEAYAAAQQRGGRQK